MPDETFEPKIVGFCCNWCSYRAADLAGTARIKYAPNVRIIRVMCSGRIDPTFVIELPAQLVPLAKYVPEDPAHVDVFEMIMGGQEIAPGYSEQNDPLLQRERFEEQAVLKQEGDEDFEVAQVLDEDFLMAMEHGMPPAGGFGLGIDRLVMALTGAESIRDVILFPHMRPLSQESGSEAAVADEEERG